MPSVMEDPHVVFQGPRPREPISLASYMVQPSSGSTALIVPVHQAGGVSESLISFLTAEMNKEIERGDTYPMVDAFTPEAFTPYFFGNFACIMVDVTSQNGEFWKEDHPIEFWNSRILGCFYVLATRRNATDARLNQIILEGVRMSVTRVPAAARGRGSGRHLAQAFLHYAPKLGYKSSIFNIVFETNIASIRLWEKLGFEKIGIVKGAGCLKGHPNLIDAYIYGYQFPEEKAKVTQDGAGAE